MLLKSFDDRMIAWSGRLVAALCDPSRRHRVALAASLAYAAVWALYATIAKSSQGINADLGEMVMWAHHLAWGYPKHPPFPAVILAGWFAVFPQADWAYYLLAAINLGIGLYISFLLAGLWLEGEKRVVAPFLLALIPFYNFIGLKFDQNSILIPLWALTTWAFVQSYRSRYWGYAALAGAAAAAAMLTKYWSAFLVLALVLAALCDRRRGAYFRSAAPWVTVLVGAALVAPHGLWLMQEDFPPLRWAGRRAASGAADWLHTAMSYVLGTLAYASVALTVFFIMARPSFAACRDILLPRETARRSAALVFWLVVLLPIPVAAVARARLLAIWNTESLGLLPIVLMSSSLVIVSRTSAARIVAFSITVSVLALVASPLVAAAKLYSGVENHAAYVPAAVSAVQREWRSVTDAPIDILAGSFALASSMSFSMKDRPASFVYYPDYLSPWIDRQALQHKGIASICPVGETACLDGLKRLLKQRPSARQVEVELTPRWLGYSGKSARFIITIMPPR